MPQQFADLGTESGIPGQTAAAARIRYGAAPAVRSSWVNVPAGGHVGAVAWGTRRAPNVHVIIVSAEDVAAGQPAKLAARLNRLLAICLAATWRLAGVRSGLLEPDALHTYRLSRAMRPVARWSPAVWRRCHYLAPARRRHVPAATAPPSPTRRADHAVGHGMSQVPDCALGGLPQPGVPAGAGAGRPSGARRWPSGLGTALRSVARRTHGNRSLWHRRAGR